jgi:hypothetical protein
MSPAARPSRRRSRENELCYEGGRRHTWSAIALDTDDDGTLVNVRECLRCDAVQTKRYGRSGSWQER